MKWTAFAGALALAATFATAAPAQADDPNDPAMRDPAARERDRQIIRKLNLDQLAYVQKRDAQLAPQWQAWRARKGGGTDSAEAEYAEARARHAQDMAAWRRAVRACEAGQWEYCDRR